MPLNKKHSLYCARLSPLKRDFRGQESRMFLLLLMVSVYFMVSVHAQALEQPKLFRVTDLSGALSLRFQLTQENETSDGIVNRDATRRFLEGGLQISSRGSIYHSNLMTFNVTMNLVAHRSKDVHFSDSSVNNSLNNTYNIRAGFLRKKKFNLDFFTIRTYTTADRAFLERYFTTFTSTGINLRTRSKWLPSELEVNTNHIQSESLSYAERDERTKNLTLRTDILKKPGTDSVLKIKAKDYSESVYNVKYSSLDATLNLTHRYGIRERSYLLSSATYHRMGGFYDLETLNFRVDNNYYLKPHFYLNGSYHLSRDSSFDRTFSRHNASIRANHKLYRSLVTQLELGGRLENTDVQRNTVLRHGFEFRYSKKIPNGAIQLNFSNRNEYANYRSREGINNSVGTYDFQYSDSILLNIPGIDVNSIRITSPDLSLAYILNVDYQVDTIQGFVNISRLPGGAIPAGEVSVYYQYLTYPDYRLHLNNYQYQARLNFFKYFYVFYIKTASHQDIRSDYLVPPFETFDKKTMGAQFMSRNLNVHYNYDDYDSSLTDYKSHTFRVSGQVKLFRKLRLSGNVNINRLTYEPEFFYSRFDAYTVECSLRPLPGLTVNGMFRSLNYQTSQFDRGRDSLIFKLQWDIRKIILNVFYERILTTARMMERGHNFFSIMIRRTF
ncbi:MAG: hypothetical protein GY765_24425 [bacterium]|nr:hypothetical protein [bacterium]